MKIKGAIFSFVTCPYVEVIIGLLSDRVGTGWGKKYRVRAGWTHCPKSRAGSGWEVGPKMARNLKSFNKKQQMYYIFSSIRLLSVIKLLSQALTLFGIDFAKKSLKFLLNNWNKLSLIPILYMREPLIQVYFISRL